jgi:hypothetical protein
VIEDGTDHSRQKSMRRPLEPTHDGLRMQAIPGAMMCLGRMATRWSAQAQLRRLFDTLDVFSQF